MSPKRSRPAEESEAGAEEPVPPPGYVPLRTERRATRKPISVWWKAGGFVVLLAATVVTIVLVGRPDPRESAHTTADLVAGSLTNADGTAYTSYLCGFNPDPPGFVDQAGATTVLSVAEGNQGVATATLTANRLPELGLVLLLHNESGSRCVEALTLCPLDGSVPGMSAEDASRCRFRPGR